MADVEQNVRRIQETLIRESAAWGRAPKLIAVTKTAQIEDILKLANANVFDIAENKVQVLDEKWPLLEGKFRAHMIGRLQTNKVKYIMDKVTMIHSVDRLELAQEIDRQAQKRNMVMPVLLQVNIAREEQKAGVTEEELPSFVRACAQLPGLSVQGLMAIMPLGADRQMLSNWFEQMRKWFDRLRDENINNTHMSELSMGMSQDYDLAARAGATMVRVGTAIFRGESV